MIGMLNASQKRMKRAALIDASMSMQPASTAGWSAIIPTTCPPRRAKPTMMFWAKARCTSKKLSRSTMRSMTVCMS